MGRLESLFSLGIFSRHTDSGLSLATNSMDQLYTNVSDLCI